MMTARKRIEKPASPRRSVSQKPHQLKHVYRRTLTARNTRAALVVVAFLLLGAQSSPTKSSAQINRLESTASAAIRLTDVERDKIRLEEEYRQQVAKQLTPKTQLDKAMEFLNNAFILWLLSSVLLATGTALWTASRERRVKRRENDTRCARLKIEAAFRIVAFERDISNYIGYPRRGIAGVDVFLRFLTGGLHDNDPFIFAEFQRRGALSLLTELEMVTDGEEQRVAQQAEQDISKIAQSFAGNDQLSRDKQEQFLKHAGDQALLVKRSLEPTKLK